MSITKILAKSTNDEFIRKGVKMKIPNDFTIPEFLKGIDWERLREELKLPAKQFWALQDLRRRQAERQARFDFFHQAHIAAGYKHREKNGVHYYWKEVKKK